MTVKADWQTCVAPMIDVTDRHCRFFHRQLAPNTRLYTEMITANALLYGPRERLLAFHPQEHPVALQLGGSEPQALAQAAKLGAQWGYDEINLNCGCPSDRVQRGAFGACLMAHPQLVAECIKAMQDAVTIPVTVKHRLGLDYNDDYSFVRDFVGTLVEAGVTVFIVHARNAVLEGLSPKDNRTIPPLRYDQAALLKRDFPEATIVLNGGLTTAQEAYGQLETFDGVMLGRAAWHTPAVLSQLHQLCYPALALPSAQEVIEHMVTYAHEEIRQGAALRHIVKPMMGWAAGKVGARHWRRTLSDPHQLADNNPEKIRQWWHALALRQA